MAGSVGERRPSRRTEESDVSITPGREMERKEERGGDTRLEIGKEGRVEKGRKRERIKFNPSEIR